MEYKGVKFDAIMATPGAGKSHLCDRYPIFVDADEVKLRCKYEVPEQITRDELERTKGDRKFKQKAGCHVTELEKQLDALLAEGKIIIFSPHAEFYEYLKKRKISFCFVYSGLDTQQDLVVRFRKRGNPESTIEQVVGTKAFHEYYAKNISETRPDVKYEFHAGEYLADIIADKFGFDFKKVKESDLE